MTVPPAAARMGVPIGAAMSCPWWNYDQWGSPLRGHPPEGVVRLYRVTGIVRRETAGDWHGVLRPAPVPGPGYGSCRLRAVMSKLPMPVVKSQPGVAGYKPLVPSTMSWNPGVALRLRDELFALL